MKREIDDIQNFRKKFKIDKKANLIDSAVAIESCAKTDKIITDFFAEVIPKSEQDGFRISSLLNLIGRTYEHVEGMLVALSTGCPASAEALGRVVVEGSINIIYLAEKGDPGTLLNFFQSWLSEHNRKLDEWKQKVIKEPDSDTVSKMIEERRKVIDILATFVTRIKNQCSIDESSLKSQWPKSLFKRFETLGRETDYYESYHRLSGASHLTGEDTLMWFLMMQGTPQQIKEAGKEAWAYSIMMTRIASLFFIDAAIACAESYDRKDNADLYKYKIDLQLAIHKIAKQAGVPLTV